MSPELGKMLRRLPVHVRENTKTDCVYLGKGVTSGLERQTVEIRVFLLGGVRMASFRIEEKVIVTGFGTDEEQEGFVRDAAKAILSTMN